MKKTTRRSFIRNTSLTATGLMFVSMSGANKSAVKSAAIGCAPAKTTVLSGTIVSVKSGKWSDATTWGGRLPQASDTPLVSSGHTVTFDMDVTTVAGVNINAGGTLQFDAFKTTTLLSTKNVIAEGALVMRPSSATIEHTLRFVGINERNFVGGGMDPLASDVGLWVMGAGRLDLVGSTKRSWTRVNNSVAAGATSFTTTDSPVGWKVGDEIFIVPTEEPIGLNEITDFLPKFERRTITAVNSSTITFNSPLTYNHMKVTTDSGKTWTAEVGNLTRNVRIEGTATGRAHIMIRSTSVHMIKNVGIRYMGPRKDINGDGRTDMVAGRYALHFHHCGIASRGSLVENCAVYDAGNHAYVPHVSHGITMRNNLSFNTIEAAFWWDFQDLTHDAIWDGNLIAACYFVPRALDPTIAESGGSFSSVGMLLGMGDGCVANNNVVVYGGVGDPHGGGGFSWEADNEGVWIFENNMAHSNHCGLRLWQNTSKNHTIINTDFYNNSLGIFHGAYTNSYTYRGGYSYNSPMEMKATSGNSSGVRFENMVFDGAGRLPYVVKVLPSPVASGSDHNIMINCTFKNYTNVALMVDTFPISADIKDTRKRVDLIKCTFSGKQVAFTELATHDSMVRIQPASGDCTSTIKSGGTAKVAPFASYIWGAGTGLKGDYYNGANFNSLAFSRIDSVIMFTQWKKDPIYSPTGVSYLISGEQFSVRWSGKMQAQFTESHTFSIMGGTGYRLWIGGKLIIDSWSEKADDKEVKTSSPIMLTAGQMYDIKMECYHSVGKNNCSLFWSSPSIGNQRLIPQAQLFPGEIITSIQEPEQIQQNQVPIANAGADMLITLPTSSVTLNGSSSRDGDGRIASYKWVKVSGPTQFSIANPTSASTLVSGLVQGSYVFRLEVTDNSGAKATDEVAVTVNADPNTGQNQQQTQTTTLTITASPNPTTSNFQIKISSTDTKTPITLRVYNSSGREIFVLPNFVNNSTLTGGNTLDKGTYYATAEQGTLKKTVTLMKM